MTDDLDVSPEDDALLGALANLPPRAPRADIAERFRARARAEHAPRWASRRWLTLSLAASLVLALAGGWWLEHHRREAEVGQLRADLTVALRDLSAATRMQGIATAERSGAHDDRVAGALVDALLRDPNANVRVAAAEALAAVGSPDALTRAAGRAFASERSPFVLAALLDAIHQLSPAVRAPLLRALLARPDLDVDVRARATEQSSL